MRAGNSRGICVVTKSGNHSSPASTARTASVIALNGEDFGRNPAAPSSIVCRITCDSSIAETTRIGTEGKSLRSA